MKEAQGNANGKHTAGCLLCGVIVWAGMCLQPLKAEETTATVKEMYERAWDMRRTAGDDVGRRAEAVCAYRTAAEAGFTLAQRELAWCYMRGWGVEKNAEVGLQWLRKAAEQGCEQSQFELGMCYVYGNGVAKDKDEARYWLQQAAAKGHPKAQQVLEWRSKAGK